MTYIMKKIIWFLSISLMSFSMMAQDQPVFEEPVNGPKIVFAEANFDFGDIKQGDIVEHIFEFENGGNEPLIISDVRTTCGCTVPSYPKGEVIPPGESGKITVRFNSRGKIGVQNKVVTIMSNAVNARERVMIKTNVMMPGSEG